MKKQVNKIKVVMTDVLLNHSSEVKRALREKAIENAKRRISISGKNVKEIPLGDLEAIVKEEEEKIVEKYKTGATFLLLAYLGIS